MILVTLSIIVTVFVLAIHFRSPATHTMSNWTRVAFVKLLPKMLFMRRPILRKSRLIKCNGVKNGGGLEPSFLHSGESHVKPPSHHSLDTLHYTPEESTCHNCRRSSRFKQNVEHALTDVKFISDHLKEEDEYSSVLAFPHILLTLPSYPRSPPHTCLFS